MSKIVISFLVAALLLIAFFTYQAHNSSIKSFQVRYDIQSTLAAYDHITLQIKDAYEQVLIFNLSGDRSQIDRYLGSEDNIYRKLSEIEELASELGQDNIPSDSLRTLISRQFLRMEKFRLRNDQSIANDSLSMKLLNESLEDQDRIQSIIDADKNRVTGLSANLGQSGVLTPAFIAFLALLGIGSVLYMSRQVAKMNIEVAGIEDKLRKNQEILSEEIEEREKLESSRNLMLNISDEFWLEVRPVRDLDEVVDFHVNMMNSKAQAILQPGDETSLHRILKKVLPDEANEKFLDELIEASESGNVGTTEFMLEYEDVAGQYGVVIQPTKDVLLLKGIYKGYVSELEAKVSELEKESSHWFNGSDNQLAVLTPQGKVVRMNKKFSEFAGDTATDGIYIWDIPAFEKSESVKHDLRTAIRELSESNLSFAIDNIVPGGKLLGIPDSRNQIKSILVNIPGASKKE